MSQPEGWFLNHLHTDVNTCIKSTPDYIQGWNLQILVNRQVVAGLAQNIGSNHMEMDLQYQSINS